MEAAQFMSVEKIKGFDEVSNAILNKASDLASKDSCGAIYSLHVIMAALEDKTLSDLIEKMTGIKSSKFFDGYDAIFESGSIPTIEDPVPLSYAENQHIELQNRLNYIKNITGRIRMEVNPVLMIRALLSGATYVNALYGSLGVKPGRLAQLRPVEVEYPALMQFGYNMNMASYSNNKDEIIGRRKELEKVVETLGRRTKCNPLIIGDAGVGKSAIIELLADRLAECNDIPEYLEGCVIISVDVSTLVGGSQYRGMFESKFNSLLESASAAGNVVLFFDEFHTLMRAGGSSENDLNAANMLKPALARQSFPVIGATTTKEYNKFIEKDEAFSRRFESIMIDEPSDDETIEIIEGTINAYEKFHNALVPHDSIEYAVKLSSRYMTDKKQPDKALTVIDQTCAHLKAGHHGKAKIRVTKGDIRDTVSRITNIDVSDLSMNELQKMAKLESKLKESVIGQDNAVKSVADAIKRSKVGFSDHTKPIGTFLFVGPTGVGKTELCKRLSDEFSGRKNNLVRLDMSEYMEKHSVSRMVGSPPGYVGYEESGQLTDIVHRNPYSVILFDEIEKAHPDVFNIMLQILDDGRLTDSHGKVVDFTNTIIIMTSNAGYGIDLDKASVGFSISNTKQTVSEDKAKKALQSTFRPEFLNRLDKIVVFNSLTEDDSKKIVKIILKQLSDRVAENNVEIYFSDELVNNIVKNGFDQKYGARNLKRYIQNFIETELTNKFIDGQIVPNKAYEIGVTNIDGKDSVTVTEIESNKPDTSDKTEFIPVDILGSLEKVIK